MVEKNNRPYKPYKAYYFKEENINEDNQHLDPTFTV